MTTSVTTPFTDWQLVITGGTGVVDPSTNSAELQWQGSFTVAYYGRMTFWHVTDPKPSVVDGVGTLTATASGYGDDMFDTSKWIELAPRQITLASLSSVKLTSQGITVVPDYLGVKVDVDGGSHQPQVSKTPANAAHWGSFPLDFLTFQAETGQLAYWYSSGGSQDPAKPTLPIYIGYDAVTFEDPDADDGLGTGDDVTPPDALERPRQVPLRVVSASATETSIDSLDALLAAIADGTIDSLSPAGAGIPSMFPIGERLDFGFDWPGDDAGGTIWFYPEVGYAGAFALVDGRVVVSLDSSVFETEGEKHFVFFGESGTALAIAATAEGFVVEPAPEPTLEPATLGETVGGGGGAGTGAQEALLLSLLAGGLGVVVIGAGGGGLLLLRRRLV